VSGWNLWSFRATRLPVAYLYDASVHSELVRFAAATVLAGRLPYNSWFPYTGLGSAQFLQYQSTPAVLTGLAGTVFGPGEAFRWSTYLLVSFWPFAIYGSARLLGFSRGAALVSGLLSPFVVSYTGIAFERGAYSWTGGAEVWTQLFGSWALVFALACSWKALSDSRYLWAGAALSGLTIAMHFECGYLALLGVAVFAAAGPGHPWRRLSRSATLFAGALVAAAWVLVPLVAMSRWASIDEPLATTPYVRGYGAGKELEWLFTGQVFDARRALPVISVAVALGAAVAVAHLKAQPRLRSLLLFGMASLVLSFGPTTLGPLASLIPAHRDLFFRRFEMGAQLAGVYLAGEGVMAAWRAWRELLRRLAERTGRPLWGQAEERLGARRPFNVVQAVAAAAFLAGALAWFWPAGREVAHMDSQDAAAIAGQRAADGTLGPDIAPLIAYVNRHLGGRVYAGLPGNWGGTFRIGAVPVYKYLEGYAVDEMTYVVPSSSLMLSPESDFDEDNPADYQLFGARYLIMPTGDAPPVPAQLVMSRGPFTLWRAPGSGYAEVVRLAGDISANRADVGQVTAAMLREVVPGEDWAVNWPGTPALGLSCQGPQAPAGARPPRCARAPAAGAGAPGRVSDVRAQLAEGSLSLKATMTGPGVLLASISYNPLWHAWVDGRRAKTEVLAPALVGVPLTPGAHHVVLRFVGFGWYRELWALSALGMLGLWVAGRSQKL
jgi:hypothetical protein